ncbi:hypothetical protein LC574_32775 [Nostoc sp. CHAB 5715]|nr:hypothetical protein [Nostoc sp. CHAB 5715]
MSNCDDQPYAISITQMQNKPRKVKTSNEPNRGQPVKIQGKRVVTNPTRNPRKIDSNPISGTSPTRNYSIS